MYSLAFPDMFTTSRTKLYKDRDATMNNLKLLLLSFKGNLLGDPYYGTNLHKIIYSNNHQILRDLIIDDIYVAIAEFMPQLKVARENILVYGDGTNLYATINAVNLLDYTTNLYEINLTETETGTEE